MRKYSQFYTKNYAYLDLRLFHFASAMYMYNGPVELIVDVYIYGIVSEMWSCFALGLRVSNFGDKY